jgi:biopolymer transport protein ExbD
VTRQNLSNLHLRQKTTTCRFTKTLFSNGGEPAQNAHFLMANFPASGKMPHVDMTPMVDLGFLLITFFMLATAFSKNKAIEVIKPSDVTDSTETPHINCQRSLTLMLDASNYAKYYSCPQSNGDIRTDSVNFSKTGLRKLLLEKKALANQIFNGEKDLIVLLKSQNNTPYKRMIDAIDELRMTQTHFILSKVEGKDSIDFQIR